MNDYIALRVDLTPCCEDATDLLAADLCEIGYESFVPDDNGLTAYIRAEAFDENAARDIAASLAIDCNASVSSTFVEGEDWNAEWEKNYFKPIVIDQRCVVHASFHNNIPSAEFDIVIDPRMAFGTGHHATTSMMIRSILNIDLDNKCIIDMGTGTGILAILCAMKGAEKVVGIEIDPAAAQNARENCNLNERGNVEILTGDASLLKDAGRCDIFLANINRNIILADLPEYASSIKSGGRLIISGFYTSDIPMLEAAASDYNLKKTIELHEGDWAAIHFVKE